MSLPLSSLILLLLLHRTASHFAAGPHIADVNILLPPRITNPVQYRLQGTDGCFKWSWDHHDILSVIPEYNSSSQCSTSARLKSIAPYGGRKETAVYATDLNTGMVIRCKVYIDKISRVQIFHNSIKLDLDGLATLRALAFDSEENVFSSLVGLQFLWQLMPDIDGSPHNLVNVPLKDSPLSDCGGFCGDLDIQVKLEDSGVFSDLYVVKGTEIGHENVYVKLLEPSMEHLKDNIVLTVAEAMSLDPPSPVYVLIGAVVRYTLKVIRGNSPYVVNLPSQFHKWLVLNSSVAQVDNVMGTAQASNLGVTAIVVEDIRVVGHMQVSSLHVVLPDNLSLFMFPLSPSGNPIDGVEPISSVTRWYVVAGRSYLVRVKVFSLGPGEHEIFITENDEIELHDDGYEFWDILPSSKVSVAKREDQLLEANSYGLGKLTATLAYNTGHDTGKEILKVVQEVMVCNQVKFVIEGDSAISQKILLPWVPGVYQELEIKVSGGCGVTSSDYRWFSSDMAVVSVSVSGIVQAKKPGKATIKAVSIFDSLNYDEMAVEVSIPSSMVMLPNFPVEVPVGSHLQASVTLKASSGAHYYACDAFKSFVKWKAENKSFIVVNATKALHFPGKWEDIESDSLPYGPPCAWTRIYASSSSQTVVHATIIRESQQYDQTFSGSIVLKSSARIAAYSPLIVHQAGDGNRFGGYWFDMADAESRNQFSNLDYLYLVPGTCLDVMLRGGPERWGQNVEFIDNWEVFGERDSNVKGRIPIASNGNQFKIGCERLGTYKVVFKRGNLMGEGHHMPAVSEVQLILVCSFPSSVVILADEPLNAASVIQSAAQAERLPGRVRAFPITVANGRSIRISAVGLSDSGKAFANSSSLSLRWELTDCEGLVLFDDAYTLTSSSTWERFLILQNTSGLCIVRSSVVGFINSISHLDFATIPDNSYGLLTDAIKLQLVSSLRVSPEFALLFFSPIATLNISITGGSCLVDTVVNDTQVVEVIHKLPAYGCSQVMVAPKNLGFALVTVYDTGIVPPLAASSTIQVAELDWIKILAGERISIEQGSFQEINFSSGVDNGHLLEPSQYAFINIHVHIEDDVVEVLEDHDRYVQAPSFTLKALRLGETTVYLSALQYSGHEIISPLVTVEVYPTPRIHPSDLFLVPGASHVLTVRGGPKIGCRVEYTSMDDRIAKIDKLTGRVSAISPGSSTLVGIIYGKIHSKEEIILRRIYAQVKVGIPSLAALHAQSEQLAVGNTMPIYPSLSEGNLFSFYELCGNYTWTVEDRDVLNFNLSHLHSPDVNFIQVLLGKAAGKTNVAVSFSCNYNLSNSVTKSMEYSASISLWVVPDLPLALGLPITWILPPYYTSSNLLSSSSHTSVKGESLANKGITYCLLGQYKRKTDAKGDYGVDIDGAKIVTKDSGNLACIQALDKSTGRIEIASCVRVAELAQIRIMTDEFLVHVLAVGDEIDLPIKYHDTLGNPFYEAHNITLFEVETNYPDVLSIGKIDRYGTIHISAKSRGLALVRAAFVGDLQKSVYVVISVGDGTTQVHFESSGLKLPTTDTGAKESMLRVDCPKEILTNMPSPAKGYALAVISSGPRNHSHFDCVVDPPDIGVAKPWDDSNNGITYCLFLPHSPEHLARMAAANSARNTLHRASVSVTVSLRGDPSVSGSSSALFVSGFSILEMKNSSSLHLNLTRDSNKSILTLIGNTDVELNWHDNNHLSIKRILVENPSLGKHVLYEIKGNGSDRFNNQLIFSLPAIHQRVEINVNYNPDGGQGAVKPGNASLWAGAFIALLMLILTVMFIISYLDRPNRPQPRSGFGSPSGAAAAAAAPATPERRSPGAMSEPSHSPRTPQPFIDYVRRTIDETPYYRQDFRRRVNPQHTF